MRSADIEPTKQAETASSDMFAMEAVSTGSPDDFLLVETVSSVPSRLAVPVQDVMPYGADQAFADPHLSVEPMLDDTLLVNTPLDDLFLA